MRAGESGTDLATALEPLEQTGLQTVAETRLLGERLASYRPTEPRAADAASSVLYSVSGLVQESLGVPKELIRTRILPHLIRLFDHHVGLRDIRPDEALFALKVLAMYDSEEALPRIARLSRDDWSAGAYLWSVLFGIYGDSEHPHRARVAEMLRSPLPSGFAAVAYLDFANTLAREEEGFRHPFDSEAGHELLRGWLGSGPGKEDSYAVSSTAALPFLTGPVRDELLALAGRHPSHYVQLESYWARAKLGDDEGVEALVRAARDPARSRMAVAYLEELGLKARIPKEVFEPEFGARAEMSAWLAHPMEFGRPPKRLELIDSREIVWPPSNERRTLYLFEYEYDPAPGTDERLVGVGMVGSVTFGLVGETTAEMTPAEIYALHCAWELQRNEDPRAPEERTVAPCMALLREANPDVADFRP